MHETVEPLLRSWESFYVIVGSSAGALTGLQFVVLTLISESNRARGDAATMAAFGSPNVVHFCTALLVSALCSAPWTGLGPPGSAAALCGVGGALYTLVVARRAARQQGYKPVFEDWLTHAILPFVAYLALMVGGLRLKFAAFEAPYVIGGAALLLVFVGIHNAWDTVTFIMEERARETHAAKEAAKAKAKAVPAQETPSP